MLGVGSSSIEMIGMLYSPFGLIERTQPSSNLYAYKTANILSPYPSMILLVDWQPYTAKTPWLF